MEVAEKDQSYQMPQVMDMEYNNTALKVFTKETYDSLTKAGSEEMTDQLNQ